MNPTLIRVLKDGRVRIHLFVRSLAGPVETAQRMEVGPAGPVALGGARGFIACKPQMPDIRPQFVNGYIEPTPCSDDVRAVTCDRCIATTDYQRLEAELLEMLSSKQQA